MTMTSVQEMPVNTQRSGLEATLTVERTDISFQDVDGGMVRITVKVQNPSPRRSRPTFLVLQSAPLGAFVPWRPLAALPVPALEPGERRELRTEVPRPHPKPLGDFNRVPPRKLLAALDSTDEPTPPESAWTNLMTQFIKSRLQTDTAAFSPLAPDIHELLGRETPHWAGNINVFIGNTPVERHLAKALRIYPGRANMAIFMVGDKAQPEAYSFKLVGLQEGWQAALYNNMNCSSIVAGASDSPLPESQWVECDFALLLTLLIRPPADCQAGKLEVHVTQRSSTKTALVEFSLDPRAQGTGCYCV